MLFTNHKALSAKNTTGFNILSVRVKEHLSNSGLNESAVKELIQNRSSCSQEQDLNLFTVIRKCNTAYEVIIQEALLIKKQNPKLNKQLCANGASFSLNIYYIIFMPYCLLL